MKSRLITLLRTETKINLRLLMVGFVVVGVSNALVLVFVHDATSSEDGGPGLRLLLMFALTVVTFVITKRTVAMRINEYVHQAVTRLRLRIMEKIQHASLLAFEGMDRSQLINAVSENTFVIVEGARQFTQGVPAGIMLVCSFVYVGYLSLPAVYIVAVCVAACTWVVWHLNRSIKTDMKAALAKEDDFLKSFHQLMDGFQELKMDRDRARDLVDNYVCESSLEARDLNSKTAVSSINTESYTYVFFYILLGATLFLLPTISEISPKDTVSLTTILLFLIGSATTFVYSMPSIAKTDTAILNIERLESALTDLEAVPETLPPSPWASDKPGALAMTGLYFAYDGGRERTFSVQVEEIRIPPGELLFIRGGNGSGKSTFLKILLGLYAPASGTISLDDVPVTDENLPHYRRQFGVVFSDFHLFDRLYGHEEVDEERLTSLLKEMGIADKTHFADGQFSNLNLSTGQRKRLALVVALLDDKPIYVLDEVAADQDPEFRRHFYEGILQRLKEEGKTVIVITHDDRYFSAAGRLLAMDYGRFVDA